MCGGGSACGVGGLWGVTCGLVLLVVVCVMFVGSARLPVGYAGADGGSIYVVFTVVLTCVWLCVNVSSRCLLVACAC